MALSGLCRRLASLSMRPAISATNTSAFHQSASLSLKEIPYLYEGVKLQKPKKQKKQPPRPTDGRPQLKGVVLKTLVKKPKKPNSANRKCVRVKLSTGREAVAYIPGEGHNLQEHHIVMVEAGKVKDLPGVKLKCVRGKYDLQHVKK